MCLAGLLLVIQGLFTSRQRIAGLQGTDFYFEQIKFIHVERPYSNTLQQHLRWKEGRHPLSRSLDKGNNAKVLFYIQTQQGKCFNRYFSLPIWLELVHVRKICIEVYTNWNISLLQFIINLFKIFLSTTIYSITQ